MRNENMKIALVNFCYSKDEKLLSLALHAIPRLRAQGHEITCHVFDDAASPLSSIPDGVAYSRTDYDRKGNLNGRANVDGMLAVFESIAAQDDFDWLVKFDSDTFINNFDWLLNIDKEKISMVGTTDADKPNYIFGPCYALSKAGIAEARRILEDPIFAERIARMVTFEDKFFSRLLTGSNTLREIKYLARNDIDDCDGLYCDFRWQQTPTKDYRQCNDFSKMATKYAVSFKANMHNRTEAMCNLYRRIAEIRMGNYVKFIEENGNESSATQD